MDKLQAIIAMLEETIERKRQYAALLRDNTLTTMAEQTARDATAKYIDVNVAELELILSDLKTVKL